METCKIKCNTVVKLLLYVPVANQTHIFNALHVFPRLKTQLHIH